MTTLMNKLTWTRMNTEPSVALPPSSHLHLPLPFLFSPSFVFYSLCTLYKYSPLSLLSVCLFLSFSYVYLFVTSPHLPSGPLHTTHHHLLLLPASTYTVTITVTYHISQLLQHEKRRTEPGMEVVMANSEF